MAKPLLRWAGSKQHLLPRLEAFWTGGNTRYVEPFAGSARLFFALEPARAILADVNSDLIHMYTVVRERPREVHAALSRWTNDEAEYYRLRALNPRDLDRTTQAARFVYLNRFCFNGLHRTNARGEFNVPYGGKRTGRLPSIRDMTAARNPLNKSPSGGVVGVFWRSY